MLGRIRRSLLGHDQSGHHLAVTKMVGEVTLTNDLIEEAQETAEAMVGKDFPERLKAAVEGSFTLLDWAHDVRPFRAAAARERTDLNDRKGTHWYGVPGRSCAGLLPMGRCARIRGVYVRPDERGTGEGTRLVEFLERQAIESGFSFIDAYAWNEPFYVGRGYEVKGHNRFGAAHVVKATH